MSTFQSQRLKGRKINYQIYYRLPNQWNPSKNLLLKNKPYINV